MDRAVPDAYVAFASRQARCLLSINHEYNTFLFRELVSQLPGPPAFQHYPYWMREGYVEDGNFLSAGEGGSIRQRASQRASRPTLSDC